MTRMSAGKAGRSGPRPGPGPSFIMRAARARGRRRSRSSFVPTRWRAERLGELQQRPDQHRPGQHRLLSAESPARSAHQQVPLRVRWPPHFSGNDRSCSRNRPSPMRRALRIAQSIVTLPLTVFHACIPVGATDSRSDSGTPSTLVPSIQNACINEPMGEPGEALIRSTGRQMANASFQQ